MDYIIKFIKSSKKNIDLNLLYSIAKDINRWMNSENSITANSKNKLSNGELFTVFGIILSSSLLTYKSINQYIKWKSLDSDRKYQYEIKLKQLENEGKQLDSEAQIKLKQLDNEGKQLDNEAQIKLKQLDNEGKQLDNEFKIKFDQT
jgi:hypothetical protein